MVSTIDVVAVDRIGRESETQRPQITRASEGEPHAPPMRSPRGPVSLLFIDSEEEHMLVSTRRILAVCVLALGLAPVTAAAAGTLTKAQVIARGSAICKAAERRVDATPSPQSQNPFTAAAPKGDAQRAIRFMAVYADSLESVRVGLAKLDAPPQGRSLLTAFIAELKPAVGAFRAGHTAALAHHYAQALTDVQRGFAIFGHASAKTKAYGFPKGVCQSGSS